MHILEKKYLKSSKLRLVDEVQEKKKRAMNENARKQLHTVNISPCCVNEPKFNNCP